ncbi:MAG TPA: TolC family protein [Pyrinomonadaceae bacterium]|jgi:HAE1 family hydrophobic/amphiphilic exporter-1|nr:TolC family protein [Pyrinomonadaceae bacterium]
MNIRRNSLLLVVTTFALLHSISAQQVEAQDQVAQNLITRETVSAPAVSTPLKSVLDRPLLARIGVQTAQPLPLSLNDAIRKALENNNTIEITRDDVRFQETQIRSILGFYDPTFNVTPTYTRNSTTGNRATNDFTIGTDMTHFVRPGGGNYQVFFNNRRTENAFAQAQVSSGSVSGSTSAIYSSSWGVTYTQPLFRNRKIDNTRRNLKIARRRLEQTDADFRRQTIDIIAQVQRTYWDLVFALRDQQNRQANLDLSKENLRQIEARIAAGASAPLARAEVETELATREADVLLATQQVSITENSLKQMLLRDATSVDWSSTYVPTDTPVFSLDSINLENAIKDAMDNRWELRRLKLATDINTIDIAYFKDQTRPRIDLNTTFSLDGLSRGGASTNSTFVDQFTGNDEILRTKLNTLLLPADQIQPRTIEIPGTPSFLVGGFNRSIANTFRSDAPNYSVGVTISFPFRNRTAKANLAGAEVTKHQIETQMRAQEQVVIVEVRNAVQAVETSRQRVLAARRARENAEIQLDGERKLFDAGKSTTFLLFQRENALTNARNSEIRAETDYNKALADLQRSTSTTLQMNNIEVDSPKDDK